MSPNSCFTRWLNSDIVSITMQNSSPILCIDECHRIGYFYWLVLDHGQWSPYVKLSCMTCLASLVFPIVIRLTFPVSCNILKIFQFVSVTFDRVTQILVKGSWNVKGEVWILSATTNFLIVIMQTFSVSCTILMLFDFFVLDLLSRDLDLGQGGTQGQSWSRGFIGDHRLPNSRNAHFFYEIHRYSDIWHFPYTLDPHRNSKFRPFGGQNTPYTLFYFIETPKRHAYLTPEHVVWAAIHTCLTPRVTGRCIEE